MCTPVHVLSEGERETIAFWSLSPWFSYSFLLKNRKCSKAHFSCWGNRDASILQDGPRISEWGNKTQPEYAGASPVHPLPLLTE